ncbi:MAG: dTDP-glucose 4,6-dehydratase [Candidatus Lokiarchaeota archaeon]|nr:dTDP-glucose 4,6-dehydratase [Candidatus Lokiarchaeota archaeon]
MKILVTGGAGFIGSNFVRFILNEKNDFEIINLDLLTYAGNLENIKDILDDPRHTFIKGDINNEQLVNSVMEDVDFVINFAAESHVDRSIDNPNIFVKTNVEGTQTLLEAAKNNEIQKFLQISSDEVYGTLGETGYFSETNRLLPNSPYSASKAAADLLVRAYHTTFNLPVLITRCCNNYGPYQYPEKFIPVILNNALQGNPIPVYGDGSNVREWIHVKDHCSGILTVLEKGKIGEIYNIGSNVEYTNIDLVKLILEIMGKPETLIQFVEDRPGHDIRYALDVSKIKDQLNWEPIIKFEKGIEQTINWYINNQDWVHNVQKRESK